MNWILVLKIVSSVFIILVIAAAIATQFWLSKVRNNMRSISADLRKTADELERDSKIVNITHMRFRQHFDPKNNC